MVIAELAGLELDDWQKYALYRLMGQTAAGKWASFENGLIVPRQDGKTEILIARMLAFLFTRLKSFRLGIYTAHEYKAAREVFLRIKTLLEMEADETLSDQVKTIRTANGEESIELRNGRRLRFLARTSGSGRGFTGDLVIMDEAYRLNHDQMAALLPTLSARPDPQLFYASMGPMDDSEVQQKVRARALAGGKRLAYIEYSIPDEASIDDTKWWAAANPAHPHRISLDFMRLEREALGDSEFARERLCSHKAGRPAPVIPADVWLKLGSPGSVIEGPPTFAVDIPPERDTGSIAVAGLRFDGVPHVELVEHRPGTGWLVERLAELLGKHRRSVVVLDPSSAAGSLVKPLTALRLPPVLVTGREMAQACGGFFDAAMSGGMVWRPGPHAEVVAVAVDAARKRDLGGAWAWHRRDTATDISPLVALTLAHYGVGTSKRRKTGVRSA